MSNCFMILTDFDLWNHYYKYFSLPHHRTWMCSNSVGRQSTEPLQIAPKNKSILVVTANYLSFHVLCEVLFVDIWLGHVILDRQASVSHLNGQTCKIKTRVVKWCLVTIGRPTKNKIQRHLLTPLVFKRSSNAQKNPIVALSPRKTGTYFRAHECEPWVRVTALVVLLWQNYSL